MVFQLGSAKPGDKDRLRRSASPQQPLKSRRKIIAPSGDVITMLSNPPY